MSKRNMLLGLAAGKVGDLVFYRDGGEQRTRTRVIPKNPRSPLQMAQRVRIANVAALYRMLAPVVRDSFSNRPSNQSGYNAFASGAIEVSPFMTKEMSAADAVLPMPAIVSKGVLPAPPYSISEYINGVLSFPVSGLSDAEGQTIGAVSQLILNAYPYLQDGDKLTAISLEFAVTEDGDADIYAASPHISEFIINSASTDVVPVTGVISLGDGAFGLNVGTPTELLDGNAAAALIVSRTDESGQLQTSFSRLVLTEAAQSLYDGYRTEKALQDAIASYNAGSESILR